MSESIKSVVIVGGGTAGWITAGRLAAKHLEESGPEVQITLIESPDIPIIGVGEGTWPTMRNTLKKIGLSETELIRQCHASFKQGAKFAKWVTGKDDDFYYHPLVLPEAYFDMNLAPHWLNDAQGKSFSEAVCYQEYLCENHLAPKQITTPEYTAVANYAYHLDAGLFSEFIKKHCISKLGVRHVSDNVTGINTKDNGDIASVSTSNYGDLEGDLFVDCTGFRSLLLGSHYNIPFKSCKHILFADSALAAQVPYETEDTSIISHTVSTAQEAGWIWDIGLSSRRGVGYVYSSDHTNDECAHQIIYDYLRQRHPNPESLSVRKITINPGHREKFWHRNCVAVGLSAGFLEPLEASALVLVEMSAEMIAEQFPVTRQAMDVIAKRFNDTFRYRWDRIIDFLKLHYMLTQRDDSTFWIDNRKEETIPASLTELLGLWKDQNPWHDDFDRAREVFPSASYQYILYGMGFRTNPSPLGLSDSSRMRAQGFFQKNQSRTEQLMNTLPTTRDLINKIKKYGLQTI